MKKTPQGIIIFEYLSDLPLTQYSLGDMRQNRTGTWKFDEPRYVRKVAPCEQGCPAGNKIADILKEYGNGNTETAYKIFLETNPFPSITGRVCPHSCEPVCNRQFFGGSVNIHALERAIGDAMASFKEKAPKSNGRRAAVVGSGPAGLACAYYLRLAGFDVDMYEQDKKAGGLLRGGIPSYRLPEDVLDREIDRLKSLGIKVFTSTKIGKDKKFDDIVENYEAVFVATGLHKSRGLGVPDEDTAGILAGLELLKNIKEGKKPAVGENVVVVGGGNTAMDVARSLWRHGKNVKVLYRRTRDEMPAIKEEVDEAINEGIEIEFLVAPIEVKSLKKGKEVLCQRMRLGEPDASGRRRPEPIPGDVYKITVDDIITAIGESGDTSFLPKGLSVKEATFGGKVFWGGDIATGEGTVVHAIASGRRAAQTMERFVAKDKSEEKPEKAPEAVALEMLNLAYFYPQERAELSALAVKERKAFEEVHSGFSEKAALKESLRCFHCGTCDACGNCYVFCPDAVISPSDNGEFPFKIDLEHCKGCGICAKECPRSAMVLVGVVK